MLRIENVDKTYPNGVRALTAELQGSLWRKVIAVLLTSRIHIHQESEV